MKYTNISVIRAQSAYARASGQARFSNGRKKKEELRRKRAKKIRNGKMKKKFSVLMSLYVKEEVTCVRECFESLLRQTVLADEWVIVEDGPLTEALYALLAEYEERYPGLIKRVPLSVNRGLGGALREGVLACSHELIARMDADDIAREDRFEKQLAAFKENPSLDICGSHIQEFDGEVQNVLAERRVPVVEKEIFKYQKRRDAFNHMTVMYKKSAVLRAGNYQDALLMEDSLLWVNMIRTGARCANVDDYLVYARTGADMYARRGGWAYYKKYKAARKKIYETGYISWWDYRYTLLVQLVIALLPNRIRTWFFKRFLRG